MKMPLRIICNGTVKGKAIACGAFTLIIFHPKLSLQMTTMIKYDNVYMQHRIIDVLVNTNLF